MLVMAAVAKWRVLVLVVLSVMVMKSWLWLSQRRWFGSDDAGGVNGGDFYIGIGERAK
jgi:hypothetical protein